MRVKSNIFPKGLGPNILQEARAQYFGKLNYLNDCHSASNKRTLITPPIPPYLQTKYLESRSQSILFANINAFDKLHLKKLRHSSLHHSIE